MSEQTPAWGIEPVPARLRVLGFFDSLLLWGNLSVSLLVIVIGALLVPPLSLRDDLLLRALAGAGYARADRLRAPLPAQVRVLGPPLLDGVPDLLGDLEVAPARVLGTARKGRLPDLRAGGRPCDRERRLVDAARR